MQISKLLYFANEKVLYFVKTDGRKTSVKMHLNTFINIFFLCTVNITFMISGIFLNSVVIISLRRSSQLRKKTCYFMILVLSCFDLAVVAITHPVTITATIFMSFGDYNIELLENIVAYIYMVFGGFSISALLTLNMERFLALTYPFFHGRVVTKERLLYFLAFLLFLTVVQSTVALTTHLVLRYTVITVNVSLLLLLFIYLNYKTFAIAKTKARDERVAPTATGDREMKRHKQNLKKISTCFLAVLCFFVCLCPSVCLSVYRLTAPPLNREYALWLKLWFATCTSANSTFNCLILFWRNTVLRREGQQTVKSMFA